MTIVEFLEAWLLTYGLHSAILLGLAWALTRRLVQTHHIRDLIWKTALVGGVVSATVQVGLGIEPLAGRVVIQPAMVTTEGVPAERRMGLADGRIGGRADGSSEVVGSEAGRPVDLTASPTADPPVRRSARPSIRPSVLLLWTWAAIALLLALHFVISQLLLLVRVGGRAPIRDPDFHSRLETLRRSAGIRRAIRVTRAEGLTTPVALGLSEICIPRAALSELDAEQQRSMLAHELAHLARRDPLWLAGACLVERVFFFQPLNRVARRRLQEAAEYLCDDWAVRRTGSGLTLAKCLVKVAEWIDTTAEPVPVSGMAELRSHFVSRIHRLVGNHALVAQPARRWLVPAALGVVVFLVAAAPGVTTADRRVGGSVGRRREIHIGRRSAPSPVRRPKPFEDPLEIPEPVQQALALA